MGRISNENYLEFLESIKAAGVEITNEEALRERLAEAWQWRFAFMTLATNGHPLGINFLDGGARSHIEQIRGAFERHRFPDNSDVVFASTLKEP